MMHRTNPFDLMQAFQNARNPQELFINLIQNNPQNKQMLTQLQNSTNGASFEQMARQIAKQKGISEEQLMQMYNTLNRK
jgi:acetyl-CoA acetyltransferase